MRTVYCDYAAATPMAPTVFAAMQPYFTDKFYNPSALYLASRDVAQAVTGARKNIAETLGAKPSEVIFTAGGTEANNLAIAGIMEQFPGKKVITSSIEHESVLKPATQYDHAKVKVMSDGRVDLKNLAQKIDDNTVLVSIMYANNEIGTVQPLRDIAKIIAEIRTNRQKNDNTLPLFFHTDACQAANYLDLHVHRLGVDLMTLNGGKIYGSKQSGILYKAAHVTLTPQIRGGGQEMNLRSGTENVAAIIGFAKALEIAQGQKNNEVERLQILQQKFINELQKMSGVTINGSTKHRLPNNVHATFEGWDNEQLMMQLDEAGIMCATGSACSASNEEVSHVLHAIGLTNKQAQSSLRFTFGRQTTEDDINYVVETLQKLLA